ncbi:retrotransposon gag domain, Retroviral aspartyl protease [Senna tora]|uniref:Retrotransposon gag domain, Retroviral aspartyl protease n=1 Tax=Senna tora TaxID=362788 RepID=A0A834SNQ8_9FABA|nr:retrotransposon gag domain, Retroviral aspartyl protease [Senna tora]
MDALMQQLAALTSEVDSVKTNQGKSKSHDYGSENFRNKSHWIEEEDGWGNSWGNHGPYKPPYTKIEFPKFDGGDLRGWILKVEKYFRYYQTPEESKVDVAAMYLEGDALDLFAWINAERTILYWEELVRALQEQYGPAEFQNPDEYLSAIKQIGTVQEYRQEFAKRAARVKNWPEHCLLGIFLNDLKDELKADVRIHKPRSVYKAISLALEYEGKLCPSKNLKAPFVPQPQKFSAQTYTPNRGPYSHNTQNTQRFSQHTQPPPNNAAATSNKNAFSNSRFSAPTFQQTHDPEWRDNGLCRRCAAEEEPETEQLELEAEDSKNNEDMAEISFHAILGRSSGTTMKLQASVKGREVIGNGDVIQCNMVCKQLSVKLPGLTITEDFYPFSIEGADLLLGIKWLASLNTVQANWNEMFLIFHRNGKKYKLQGVPKAEQGAVTFQSMVKHEPREESKAAPPCIQTLITKFPQGLNLGIAPPNVRPYRPLTDLTKKDAFKWSPTTDLASQRLKQVLTQVPVLRLPDFSSPFTIECDAFADAIGAILLKMDILLHTSAKDSLFQTDTNQHITVNYWL